MSSRSLEKHELPLAHTKPVQRSFRGGVWLLWLYFTVKLGKTCGQHNDKGEQEREAASHGGGFIPGPSQVRHLGGGRLDEQCGRADPVGGQGLHGLP